MFFYPKSRPRSSARHKFTPEPEMVRAVGHARLLVCTLLLSVLTPGFGNRQADAYAIGEAHEEYAAMLHRMDKNGDNLLQKQELLDVNDEILVDDQQAGVKLDAALKADADGNGILERKEWIKYRSGWEPPRKDEL